MMAVTSVTAETQRDLVGPEGVFEKSVSEMMTREKGMSEDLAEMLVAVDSLGTAAEGEADLKAAVQTDKLNNALKAMDEVQELVDDLYDKCYNDFLDLYPEWRMYVLCKDPKRKNDLFVSYSSILARYNARLQQYLENLGKLVAYEKALLPSNLFQDPENRIEPSPDTVLVLNNFC